MNFPINPVKEARQSLGWKQAELAQKAQLTVKVVTWTELGLYQDPSQAILNALVRGHSGPQFLPNERTAQTLGLLWYEWRDIVRKSQSPSLIPRTIPKTFQDYINDVGPHVYGFCRKLMFDPANVYTYMKGKERPILFETMRINLPANLVDYLEGLPRA